MKKTLMVLDGNSIVNRAFFGVPALSAPDGTPTNAIFGFMNILHKLLADNSPEALCVCFDIRAKTFRHRAYSAYKAKRSAMPEELDVQFPILKSILRAMNICCYELEGYEADDLIGSISKSCEQNSWSCVVVSGDRDSLQLITENCSVALIKSRAGQTEYTLYTPDIFALEYGFSPRNLVDLKALMGDSSDNISGVKGIGEKTARDLISSYTDVFSIYSLLNDLPIKDSVKKRLVSGKNDAFLSYWLASINCDVEFGFSPEKNIYTADFSPELYNILSSLKLKKTIEKWGVSSTKANNNPNIKKTKGIVYTYFEADDINSLDIALSFSKAERVAISYEDIEREIIVFDGIKIYIFARPNCLLTYDELLEIILSDKVKKIGTDTKDKLCAQKMRGLPACSYVFDVALAGYLLNPGESDYSTQKLSQQYKINYTDETVSLFLLYDLLLKELRALSMDELYYAVELPLCEVLADMELYGFQIDKAALREFGEYLDKEIINYCMEIWEYAGEEFNIQSPKQLGDILFVKLDLPHGKRTKSGFSTDAETLEKLRDVHPIIDLILDYRMFTKLKSTYVDSIMGVLSPQGRVHTHFQMMSTATGRLSSTKPNLQNIPIRKKLGSQIRKMFVASPGMVLVDADYSQIELRILAELSGDKTMIDAFLSGKDFHTITASNVFDVPIEEVDASLRSKAKAVNFGVIYGISSFGLAQDIKISTKEAAGYIKDYKNKYTGVSSYMDDIVAFAKKNGYVTTLFNRIRYIPELKSKKYASRSFGERIALNSPIQGTAADIIKIAMIKIRNRLSEEIPGAALVLQVHDELIVECREDESEKVAKLLKEEMENCVKLNVPLAVEVHVGHNWAEAH